MLWLGRHGCRRSEHRWLVQGRLHLGRYKMSMRLHFVMGAKNGSTSRGQGHYQAGPVTLQLLDELAFQKGPCPFATELHNLPLRKTALSQNGQPGLQISPVQRRLSCHHGRLPWTTMTGSEGQAADFTPSSSCTFSLSTYYVITGT